MTKKHWIAPLLGAALTTAGCDSNNNATGAGADFELVKDVVTTKANDLRGLAYASNGALYVSGHVGTVADLRQTVVGRFDANGDPDPSFGDDGFVTVDVAVGRNEQSLAVAELANGHVVAVVNAADADGGQSVYLLRFDANGVQQKVGDGWGDVDGKVEVVFGWANVDNGDRASPPTDTAWDLLVDPSGGGERLVVAGMGAATEASGRTDNDRYVVRLNATDGSVDPAFNGGAPQVYHSVGVLNDNARRASVEADGAILASGYTNLGTGLGNHIILIRLTPAGALDTTFGNFVDPTSSGTAVGLAAQPGVAVFNPFLVDGGFAEAYGAARQTNGDYVTTGYGGATANGGTSTLGYASTLAQDLVAFRVNSTQVDSSWGNSGTQAVQSEGQGLPTDEDRGRDLVLLADDRSVHAGRYGGVPALFVLTADGQPDIAVSDDGIIELPNSETDAQFFNVDVSADGRLAATTNENANGGRLVILAPRD